MWFTIESHHFKMGFKQQVKMKVLKFPSLISSSNFFLDLYGLYIEQKEDMAWLPMIQLST